MPPAVTQSSHTRAPPQNVNRARSNKLFLMKSSGIQSLGCPDPTSYARLQPLSWSREESSVLGVAGCLLPPGGAGFRPSSGTILVAASPFIAAGSSPGRLGAGAGWRWAEAAWVGGGDGGRTREGGGMVRWGALGWGHWVSGRLGTLLVWGPLGLCHDSSKLEPSWGLPRPKEGSILLTAL